MSKTSGILVPVLAATLLLAGTGAALAEGPTGNLSAEVTAGESVDVQEDAEQAEATETTEQAEATEATEATEPAEGAESAGGAKD